MVISVTEHQKWNVMFEEILGLVFSDTKFGYWYNYVESYSKWCLMLYANYVDQTFHTCAAHSPSSQS